MRVATRTASLVIPRLRTVAPAISAVLLLLLGACAADTPTVPGDQGGSTLVARFPVAAGATQAAAMATNQLVRRLPTLQAANCCNAYPGSWRITGRIPWLAVRSHVRNGGPVVTEAMSYNLYVNCSGTPTDCWGTGSISPATYLRDLNVSPLLEVANQYLNEDVPGKFAVTELEGNVAFAPRAPQRSTTSSALSTSSASNFVGASTGYTNIFHVFLPRGTGHVHHGILTATRPTTRRRGPSARSMAAAWISARANTSCTRCNPTKPFPDGMSHRIKRTASSTPSGFDTYARVLRDDHRSGPELVVQLADGR